MDPFILIRTHEFQCVLRIVFECQYQLLRTFSVVGFMHESAEALSKQVKSSELDCINKNLPGDIFLRNFL